MWLLFLDENGAVRSTLPILLAVLLVLQIENTKAFISFVITKTLNSEVKAENVKTVTGKEQHLYLVLIQCLYGVIYRCAHKLIHTCIQHHLISLLF